MAEKKNPNNPYLDDSTGHLTVTEQGHDHLAPMVTSTTDPVYAFTDQANMRDVAGAMARLSRRDSDLRVTLLDEFAMNKMNAEELVDRVLGRFGDDSVGQMITIPFVTEDISNLMTKQIEWGRVGVGYIEQSTRFIEFDKRDANGRFKYTIPPEVMGDRRFTVDMDVIFAYYSRLVHGIQNSFEAQRAFPCPNNDPASSEYRAWKMAWRGQACDAARLLLPTATASTVGCVMTAQAIEALLMRLRSSKLREATHLAAGLLGAVREVAPEFFTRVDRPDRGVLTSAYMADRRNTMSDYVANLGLDKPTWTPDQPQVTLVSWSPVDELELVEQVLANAPNCQADMFEIQGAVDGMRMEDRRRLLNNYIGERLNRRHKPDRALEEAHFTWELVGDYGTFRDLQRHRMVDNFHWPMLTPHLGSEEPGPLVEAAGQVGLWEDAFMVSKDLWNNLNSSYGPEVAQYATLLGHRMIYRFTTNLRELFHLLELRTSPQGHPGYRHLCNLMYQEVQKVYPTMAGAMKFVNQNDTLDELTRMTEARKAVQMGES